MAEENKSIVETAGEIAKQTIGALPPAFLLLVLLNIAFLGLILWFLENQMTARMELVTKIIEMARESCPSSSNKKSQQVSYRMIFQTSSGLEP